MKKTHDWSVKKIHQIYNKYQITEPEAELLRVNGEGSASFNIEKTADIDLGENT